MSEATAGRLSGGGRLCWGAGESPESIFTRRPRRSCWLWAGAVAPSQGCSKWPGPQPCTVALGRSTSYTAAAGCNTVSQRAGRKPRGLSPPAIGSRTASLLPRSQARGRC